MKYGFIKVCAAAPEIRPADVGFNRESIFNCVKQACKNGAKVAVLPELCVTGYTCGDLFLQSTLISSAEKSVAELCAMTENMDILCLIGTPAEVQGKLYNCAAAIYSGKLLALIPKMNIPNYAEFYEGRHFSRGSRIVRKVSYAGFDVPFGTDILIKDKHMNNFVLAAEICEDLWTVNPPSGNHALAGATIIANLSASDEVIAKEEYRKNLVLMQSARLFAGYIYASSGFGESTTDVVYGGDCIIGENGAMLSRSELFAGGLIFAEFDLERLAYERRKTSTFVPNTEDEYCIVETEFEICETSLTRKVERMPFVPRNPEKRAKYSEEILTIQAMGLKKRLVHTRAKAAVIGISGGLDSTLALLVTARAFDEAGLDRKNILAVTMPCFGTTNRTYNNAVAMSEAVGAQLKEINIQGAVLGHFDDIGQDKNVYDVTYENSQARERTQVLMDIANKLGGLVIGTGDMSEMALGWATYNGDHMSMYAVNSGVPKTLIRYLVEYEAERTNNEKLKDVLADVLDTPVSPELLPPENGEISQKTEQTVGPYLLHDFFLYYMLRFGFGPKKIYYLAQYAFSGEFSDDEILRWLEIYYRRFFTQQFKRSCIPDGPKVGSVALSPRGDWRMPSDAVSGVWMDEIKNISKKQKK